MDYNDSLAMLDIINQLVNISNVDEYDIDKLQVIFNNMTDDDLTADFLYNILLTYF